jgi:hypothetical protein
VSPARKSPWWRAFDRIERAIGAPLEEVVASPTYIDVMVAGMRVQRAIGRAVFRRAGGTLEFALHVARVPTSSDIRRLNQQQSALATEIRALSLEVERSRREQKAGDGD